MPTLDELKEERAQAEYLAFSDEMEPLLKKLEMLYNKMSFYQRCLGQAVALEVARQQQEAHDV